MAMGRLDALNKAGLRAAGHPADLNRFKNRATQGGHRRAFTPHGHKYHTRFTVRFVQTPRQRRAGQASHFDLAPLDQSQRHGVLVVAQKAFGPINGVQRPVALTHSPVAGVDPVAHGRSGRVRVKTLHESGHQFQLRGMPSQISRVFFSHNHIVGKRLAQKLADQRLGAKIGHGDRAVVILFQRRHHQLGPDHLAQRRGPAYRFNRNLFFEGVTHLISPNCRPASIKPAIDLASSIS